MVGFCLVGLPCKLPGIGKQLPTFPYIKSRVRTADLKGGSRVYYPPHQRNIGLNHRFESLIFQGIEIN